MQCKKCGKEMYDEDRYCLKCGFDNQLDYIKPVQHSTTITKKKNGYLYFIPLILLIFAVFLFKGSPILNSTNLKKETPQKEYASIERFNPNNVVGTSNKDIKSLKSHFSVSPVKDDTTGNLRVSTISEDINMTEYAKSYYETYFSNNEEIHVITNPRTNTTTKINCSGNVLNITILEYTGQEPDAKNIFAGRPISFYILYLDNGDIEKVK